MGWKRLGGGSGGVVEWSYVSCIGLDEDLMVGEVVVVEGA